MVAVVIGCREEKEGAMSRLSADHRSAQEEMRTVVVWSLITLTVIALIAISVFLWAFTTLPHPVG
jgi:hypothetical protein